MLKIDAKVFFRDKEILKFMDAKTARAMSRALSHIWRRAQTSMRYRKSPSRPGQPPSAHQENRALLRQLMRFAFDPREKRGVVGPLKHRKGLAPSLNEFGGVVLTQKRRLIPIAKSPNAKKKKYRSVPAGTPLHYPSRPFMEPALQKEIPRLPEQWSHSVSS